MTYAQKFALSTMCTITHQLPPDDSGCLPMPTEVLEKLLEHSYMAGACETFERMLSKIKGICTDDEHMGSEVGVR